MAHSFRKGAKVQWKWGSGTAWGTIAERFERRVSRTIEGKRITRVGTADNPAFLVTQDDGGRVLKRASELQAG